MNIDFVRLDACPRCHRNTPDDPEPGHDRASCPVCRGKPVRCAVLWNASVESVAAATGDAKTAVVVDGAARALRDLVDLVQRPTAACGPVVRVARGAENRGVK